MNESDLVVDLFRKMEDLHIASALTAPELAAKDAALARGCLNYWPHRGRQPGPASNWFLGACALTPDCTDRTCLWFPTR